MAPRGGHRAGEARGEQRAFDAIGAIFGEDGLGRVAEVATGSVEGALFAACLAGAMAAALQKADA